MHTTDPHGAGHASGPGHELSDAQVRPLAESGVMLVVVCLAAFWSMIWYYDFLRSYELKKDARTSALAAERTAPPAPLLETAPHMPVSFGKTADMTQPIFKTSGLADVRAEEYSRLNSYGWVDEQGKVVHIPIQQAMQRLLEKGVPTRK